MRILFKTFLVLVLTAAAALAAIYAFGHILIASDLEARLGVPVKVGKMTLDPSRTSVRLEGVQIMNPPQFSEGLLAEAGPLEAVLDAGSLVRGRVLIRELHLNIKSITVEKNPSEKLNLLQLKPFLDPGKEEPDEKEPRDNRAGQRAVTIEKTLVSLGAARYSDYSGKNAVIKEFDLNIKGLVLERTEDPGDIIREIVGKVLVRVGMNALIPDFAQFQEAFRVHAAEGIKRLKEGFQSLTEKFKQDESSSLTTTG